MYYLISSLITLLFFVLTIQNLDYRLHVPTAAEYLQSVPEILRLHSHEIEDDFYPDNFSKLLEMEVAYRYPSLFLEDFDLIDSAYNALADNYPIGVNRAFWNDNLVLSWLKTNSIDLDATLQLDFEEFVIAVTALDFNVDGVNEWVLDIRRGEDYHSYLVLQRVDETYDPVETPLPYLASGYDYEDVRSGTLETLQVSDVTGDDVPEWMVVLNNVGEYGDRGRLYILNWQNGALLDIGDENLSFIQPSIETLPIIWEFLNVDDDSALEIEQSRQIIDNWGCQWTEIAVFNWSGSQFIKATVSEEFPETDGCIRRKAETSMWEGDYEMAISLYERLPRSIALTEEQARRPVAISRVGNHSNYSDIRLAIAYIMTGQEARGIEMLESLLTLPEERFKLSEYVDVLLEAYKANPTAIGLCITAYNFVMYDGYYFWNAEIANLEVGYTIDNNIYGQGMYIPPPASPITAGCDAPTQLEQIINDHIFTSDESPEVQLQMLGISASYVLNTDLNSDGQDEWLIWPSTIQVKPIFFVPDGDIYHVTRPSVIGYPPTAQNRVVTWELPDNLGQALVNLDFAVHYYQRHAGYGVGGGPGCPNSSEYGAEVRLPGNLRLWRLVDKELVLILDAPLCELGEIDEIFADGPGSLTVNAWTFDDYQGYVRVVYTWDPNQQNYILMPLPTPTTQLVVSITYPASIYQLLAEAQEAFDSGDFETVVENLAIANDQLDFDQSTTFIQLHYLGALALEALNRPDEALADYIVIYETEPESAWGMLAALHLIAS